MEGRTEEGPKVQVSRHWDGQGVGPEAGRARYRGWGYGHAGEFQKKETGVE